MKSPHPPEPACCSMCGSRPLDAAADLCPACSRRLLDLALPGEDEPDLPAMTDETCGAAFEEIFPSAPLYGHYQVLQRGDGSPWELGRGAMGITYKAFDTNLRCPVALKIIHPDCLEDAGARQRFLREARAAARLRHPNIASVFHLGESGGKCFYVMELIDGETLAERVRRCGPLPPALALNIASQIACALIAAHHLGFIHRDIKPANVMLVDEEGAMCCAADSIVTVKLIDFGLVTSALLETPGKTHRLAVERYFVGTPHFASPEQLAPHGAVDGRADLYSLGATLWYMLTGVAPFRNTSGEPLAPSFGIIPGRITPLLRSLLAPDPARRPPDPAAARMAIEQCAAALAPPVRPSHARGRWTRSLLLLLAMTAAAFGGVAWQAYVPALLPPERASIVVLPWHGVYAQGQDDPLNEGLVEDLTGLFSKVSDLRVISHESAVRHQPNLEPAEVARQLGVTWAVASGLHRRGDLLEIRCRLINAAGSHPSREEIFSCEGENRELSAMERHLAQRMLKALRAESASGKHPGRKSDLPKR